jgi:hypothetical protein
VNAITELTKVIGMVLIKETRSGGVTNFDLPRNFFLIDSFLPMKILMTLTWGVQNLTKENSLDQ